MKRKYPEYKECGIEWLGEVPEHWSLRKLKYAVTLTKQDAEERHEEFQIALENIESWTGQFIETDSDYSGSGDAFEEGDILFNKLRPYLAKVYHAQRAGTPVGELLVFRPEPDVSSRFLFYRLLSVEFIDVVDGSTYGAKMPRASWDFIGDLQIPIPPLEEQRTIAAYLDRKTAQIDTLIAKKQRLIDLLQEQRTAVINRAVTRGLDPDAPMQDSGIEWLGEVPAHWTMVRVKHLAQMSAGPFGSSLTKDMYTSSGYRVYGQEQVIPGDFSIGDYYISEDKYNDMSRYQVSVGDVLVSCVGTFGKVAVVPEGVEPGVINPRLIKLTPNKSKVDPEYLELILKAKITFDQLEQVSRGGTMGVINIGLLSDIVIPLPPLEEQRRILSRVRSEKSEIDTLIQREELLIEKLQELRTSLISEVVTGKIDIRDEVPQRAEVAA